MKILQVIPYFTWSYGGPVRVVYDISQKLSEMGHNVTIFTTDVGIHHRLIENEKVKLENVDVRYFGCVDNWIANNMKLHISFEMFSTIKKELRNFDIIHLHESRGVPNAYIWYYAKKYGIPYVLQAHGASPRIICKQSVCRSTFKILYDAIIGKDIIDNASKILALTKIEAELYKNIVDKNKICVIPNGINTDQYINLPQKGEFRRKYFIKDNEKIILYLGRINEIKGIDLLIYAFKDLTDIFDNIKLIIAGPDDGFLPCLKSIIHDLELKDKILYTGPLYDVDKLEAYTDADIYVLPSIYETFPMSILEACACGKPVIVTDRCGMSDRIENNAGYVVKYDKDQLCQAISKLLHNEELIMKFGNMGKMLVKEELSLDKVVIKLENLYKSVIKEY